ncbi:hypothetical protein [Streptomyces niveus]|uniref:hypothetical protein n=1 Tax=Streptomyces niveus TaxID=193462 RepID=UPI0035DA7D57
MLDHYLDLGGTEIANPARLAAYLETVGSPLDSTSGCGCDTFTAAHAGDEEYTTPEGGAPWYDPDVPSSAEFTGLMVLSVDGLDDHPVVRTTTPAVTGGAALGPARVQARTITVTGVLLGATCCGVEYGLRWLAEALAGTTGAGCGGDCLTLFNCCPGEFEEPEEFVAEHRRTLRRVALVSAPSVIARTGSGCSSSGGCSTGADMLTVEFVLTAGTPWLWTDPVPVLDVPVPSDDGTECVTWCIHSTSDSPTEPVCLELLEGADCLPGTVLVEFADASTCGPNGVEWEDEETAQGPCMGPCRHAPCPVMDDLCSDPSCRTPAPPVAPPPANCHCTALAVNTAAYELDLSSRPTWFGAAPIIDVNAGSEDLRRVTVTLYERTTAHDGLTCEEIAELERCNPHSAFEVGYVPAGGTVTLDGQVSRAMVECAGVCETSPDAFGRDGGPLSFPLLRRGQYCVIVEADAIFTPASDATVTLSLSGRNY